MGVTTTIGTNSWAGKAGAAYFYYYNRQIGNSFYGLTAPMNRSQIYYYLANNQAPAGARMRRPALGLLYSADQSNDLSISFM